MFVDVEGTSVVALSQVRRKRDGRDGSVVIELIGGDEAVVPFSAWEAALDGNFTISVPAPAGTWLVLEDHTDGIIHLSSVVIIGFVVSARGLVRALTSQGVHDADAVLFADGHVEVYDQPPFGSLEAFAAYLSNATGKRVVS